MERLSELQPMLELAFREGGKGIFWTVLGGIVGLTLSLTLVVGLFIIASRTSWPTREKWGRWCRILLLIYAMLTVPATGIGAGVGWGLITSVINVINHEQWIQKASEEGLNELVAIIYVQLGAENTGRELSEEKKGILIAQYSSGEKSIPIDSLKQQIELFQQGRVQSIAEMAHEKFEVDKESLVSRLGALIAKQVWTWLAKARVETVMAYADEVIERLKIERKGNTTNTGEIAFVIGEVVIKPHVDEKMEEFQSSTITLGFIQVGLLLIPPIGIVWIVALFAAKKKFQQDAPLSTEKP